MTHFPSSIPYPLFTISPLHLIAPSPNAASSHIWGGLGSYKGRYFGESSEVEIEFCYSHEIQNNIGAKVFIP
jgi:hypothetical protein